MSYNYDYVKTREFQESKKWLEEKTLQQKPKKKRIRRTINEIADGITLQMLKEKKPN